MGWATFRRGLGLHAHEAVVVLEDEAAVVLVEDGPPPRRRRPRPPPRRRPRALQLQPQGSGLRTDALKSATSTLAYAQPVRLVFLCPQFLRLLLLRLRLKLGGCGDAPPRVGACVGFISTALCLMSPTPPFARRQIPAARRTSVDHG